MPTLTALANGITENMTSPGVFASAPSLSTRFLDAVFRLLILVPPMEPVLSSTSAMRSRLFPQVEVEPTLKSRVGKPAICMNWLLISPDAAIVTVDPLPLLLAV